MNPQPIRVLLVEDSDHDQIAFQRALQRSSSPFSVTVCERAEDIPSAVQAGSQSFDMVVVDYNLPGITGLEAYQALKHESNLPPFVLLTGAGSERLAVEALTAGMADYIIKDPALGYLGLLPLKLESIRQRHQDQLARQSAQASLKKAHAELETIVSQRTAELARTVDALRQENVERRRTERALRQSHERLRRLSHKIISTQENERRQMAKELHDSIGSSLAAIKFALEGRLNRMAGAAPDDSISLETIIEHLQGTIQEVRRISSALRPSMLDDLGLKATIQWFGQSCREIYRHVRIDTQLDMQDADVAELDKIVIYRVMQEALNNALKHSGGDLMQVRIETCGDRMRMAVSDNGCGFDLEDAMQKRDLLSGYGLQGMLDRVEAAGGSLSFDSTPGRGTTVSMELPLKTDRDPA
ncbi:MAG: response regulator [Desulfosarcina sp.]